MGKNKKRKREDKKQHDSSVDTPNVDWTTWKLRNDDFINSLKQLQVKLQKTVEDDKKKVRIIRMKIDKYNGKQ